MSENASNAIVVLSSDRTNDLIGPFCANFTRAWRDCKYTCYVITNTQIISITGFSNVLTGPRDDWENDWAQSLRIALQQIPEDNLLILLDDFLINQPNLDLVAEGFRLIQSGVVGCLHTKLEPKLKINSESHWIRYPRDFPYQSNLSAFWNKSLLLRLLADGENPWDFEIQGSKRLGRIGIAGALVEDAIPFIGLIEKGSWIRGIQKIQERHDLKLELSERKIQGFLAVNFLLKRLWFNFMIRKIPYGIRIKAADAIKKLLASY